MSIADKLIQIAENEPKVFEAGKAAGKKAEYDAFWDSFQDNGNRNDYQCGFGGKGWIDQTFKPKYDIILGIGYTAMRMFWDAKITDLAATLEQLGLQFDTSKAYYFDYMFQWCTLLKRVPPLDFSGTVNGNKEIMYVFSNCGALETIDKMIVPKELKYTGVFGGCYNLVNLIVEGTIGQNGFDLKDCTKLSKASIESVIRHLSKETIGLTVTFSKAAVDKAFETSEGANDGSTINSDYFALINGYPEWTFSLV